MERFQIKSTSEMAFFYWLYNSWSRFSSHKLHSRQDLFYGGSFGRNPLTYTDSFAAMGSFSDLIGRDR